MVGTSTTRRHSSCQWLLRMYSCNPVRRPSRIRLLGPREWTRSTKELPRDQDGMGSTLEMVYNTCMPCGKHSSRYARLFALQLDEELAINWLESINAHALSLSVDCESA